MGLPPPMFKKGVNISVVHILGRNMETDIFISERKMVILANHSGLAKRSGLRNLKSRKSSIRVTRPSMIKMFFARFAGTTAIRKILINTPIPAGTSTKFRSTGINNT